MNPEISCSSNGRTGGRSITAHILRGEERTVTEYTVIDENWTPTELNGWYVVDGEEVDKGGLSVNGEAHIILKDGSALYLTTTGLHVGASGSVTNAVTIYGQQEATGVLVAWSASYCAAIGGQKNEDCGRVTINGGRITAARRSSASGIGGGCEGGGGQVTINGGTVIAAGGQDAPGIGRGAYGWDHRSLTIAETLMVIAGATATTAVEMSADDYIYGRHGYVNVAPKTQKESHVLFDSFAPGPLNPKGATYNGFLGEDSLGGTFTLVVKKPKKGSMTAVATLTKIDPATGKKVKITGTVDVATGVCGGDLAGLELNAQGVGGSLGGVTAQGAVDAAKAKDADALAVMNGFNKKAYGLVFADAAGEEAYLTAVFSTKGKVKVAGSYRGAKVSGNAQTSVGDAVCAVPFVWSKKGVRVSFVLWFDRATRALVDVSGLGAGATLIDAGIAGGSAATYPFVLDETALRESVPDAIAETFLPLSIRFDGKKFDAGKAAKVSYKKGVLTVDTSKGDNVTGLKLSYSKGVLKGSFTVCAVTGGKLVKNKFTVAGVLIDGVGYAAGTNKKLKSIPLVLAK